ncbi:MULTISPECIES: phospholipase D family nuclease [Polaromonas]|uniref:phospholipase D n=1 Tax=Polaromonas aquatica TaxID=332657 RepID=A0ABW1TYD5_9BURK
MTRAASFFKAALASALMLAFSHSFAFDLTSMVMKTAAHSIHYKTAEEFTKKALSSSSSSTASSRIAAAGTIEVAFSPNEGAEALVVKTINSAQREIRVLSYSFTSAPVTQALLHAKKRGVDVKLVADHKNNVSEDRSGKARAALSALVTAGVDVRTISVYAIHHDKVIVVDGTTTELGSFNFSASAASRNSENVLVNWNNPALAKVYLDHFQRNYRQASPYETRY